MKPPYPSVTNGAILILEPQTASLQIAQYAREQGYAPIVVTVDRHEIETVREPYRTCLDAISDWHIVDCWRPDGVPHHAGRSHQTSCDRGSPCPQ